MRTDEEKNAMDALAQGDYLKALRLFRRTVNDADPLSYDSLAYLLQALGRFDESDEVLRRRLRLEQQSFERLGMRSIPKAQRCSTRTIQRLLYKSTLLWKPLHISNRW